MKAHPTAQIVSLWSTADNKQCKKKCVCTRRVSTEIEVNQGQFQGGVFPRRVDNDDGRGGSVTGTRGSFKKIHACVFFKTINLVRRLTVTFS